MKNDPMEFLFERGIKTHRIFPYPIHADINLRIYRLAWLRQVESKDVGIIIVTKKLSIYMEQIIIRAENIAKITQPGLLPFEQAQNE